jgi:hypothetical protein
VFRSRESSFAQLVPIAIVPEHSGRGLDPRFGVIGIREGCGIPDRLGDRRGVARYDRSAAPHRFEGWGGPPFVVRREQEQPRAAIQLDEERIVRVEVAGGSQAPLELVGANEVGELTLGVVDVSGEDEFAREDATIVERSRGLEYTRDVLVTLHSADVEKVLPRDTESLPHLPTCRCPVSRLEGLIDPERDRANAFRGKVEPFEKLAPIGLGDGEEVTRESEGAIEPLRFLGDEFFAAQIGTYDRREAMHGGEVGDLPPEVGVIDRRFVVQVDRPDEAQQFGTGTEIAPRRPRSREWKPVHTCGVTRNLLIEVSEELTHEPVPMGEEEQVQFDFLATTCEASHDRRDVTAVRPDTQGTVGRVDEHFHGERSSIRIFGRWGRCPSSNLTDCAQTKKLATRDRLALFSALRDAVHHGLLGSLPHQHRK